MRRTLIITLLLLLLPGTAFTQEESLGEAPVASVDTAAPVVANTFGLGVAARIAVAIPTSKLGVMALGGLEIDFLLPVLERRLVIALDVTLTGPSYEGSGTDPRVGGDYTYTIDELEGKVSLDIVYRLFTEADTFIPFFGIGPVIQFLQTTQTTSFAPGENTEQSTDFGVEALAGLDWRLGPGFLFGELRYAWTTLEHDFTGSTNAGNFNIGIGYRMIFF